jgi:methylated-DNA-[protein]-cysteine S-methyltransferase
METRYTVWTTVDFNKQFTIFVAGDDIAIRRATFHSRDWNGRRDDRHPLLQRAATQLGEYFGGKRSAFELPLAFDGTEFQKQCWHALLEIPYGETRSYGEQARRIGRPSAARAVGMANHDNPIAILIPCHRVIAADGSLAGFGGGIAIKRALLELEGALESRAGDPRQLPLRAEC